MDTDDTNIQMKIIVNIKYVELTLKKLLRIKFINSKLIYSYQNFDIFYKLGYIN